VNRQAGEEECTVHMPPGIFNAHKNCSNFQFLLYTRAIETCYYIVIETDALSSKEYRMF
jgi:hypothetical protein